MLPHIVLSRRYVLAGAALAVACVSLPSRGQSPAEGFRVLRARPGTAALRGQGQAQTPIWGYDGSAPGPVLRVKRGDELRVRLVNELPEPTTVHWHGVRVPNAMDGVPDLTQPPVPTGAHFDYRFRPRDAGTFWYHPAGHAAAQSSRGLRGALIVEEAEPVAVDRDVVLLVEDWPLAADGTIAPAPGPGQHLTVNGAPQLELPVRSNERVRLRIVNAAVARTLDLRVDRHAPVVMAIDGQPAEPFPARDARVVLGPGNRIDLFVDASLAPGSRASILARNDRGEQPLVHFVYEREAARASPLPEPKPLPGNPLPARLDLQGAARHDLPLGDLAQSPLFRVRRGRTVVLTCVNRSEFVQAVHVHGHSCRLLDRLDDGWKPFWLDTVTIERRQTDRLAFLADNPGRWLIETQALASAPPGGGVWFEVT